MKRPLLVIFILFLSQIILSTYGNRIFHQAYNPLALMAISILFTMYSFQWLARERPTPDRQAAGLAAGPWLYALAGMLGLFAAYEELRKIWAQYPEPEKISDVLPQLQTQCQRFFAGEFPYQIVKMPNHEAFPVYMPLHWMPVQIAGAAGIDIRWSGMILLLLAVGVAGYWLAKRHPSASWKLALPGILLFALPVWAYIFWARLDIAVSLETVVAAWYLLLAAGLASKNHVLIAIGICGALLSRYTLLFWIPMFAILLWLHAPRSLSYRLWGAVLVACIALFVAPFWLKDPSILSKILAYYSGCSEGSWLRPDEYTFLDALSLNIHLRHWLPGTPEENLRFAHVPQIAVQLLTAGLGMWFYQKKWRQQMDVYTFSLLALSIMIMLFYIFSPMLFKYYMLMPLTVSAVVCWKVLADFHINSSKVL